MRQRLGVLRLAGRGFVIALVVVVLAACQGADQATPIAIRAPVVATTQAAPTTAPSTAGTKAPAAAAPTAPAAATKPPVTAAAGASPVAVSAAGTASPGVAATRSAGAPSVAQPKLPPIADVADKVRPAVAFIAVRSAPVRTATGAQPQSGVGSGAIFDSRGYIFTNNHVIAGGQQIKVVLPDGRTFDAKLVGADPNTDLAVLKIDGQSLPVAKLGDSDKTKVGEWVVAIGNALGLEGGPTVTAGVVSATGRSVDEPGGVGRIESAIQTDTAINPGNSGGPLINMNGEIIGINTLVAGQVSGNYQAQGIGFAISINSAKPIIDELVAKGSVQRPYLGVTVGALTPAIAQQIGITPIDGLIVSSVTASGPAARAGLREGDVITAVDGMAVKTTTALRDILAKHKIGDRVELTIVRNDKQQKLTLQLTARPQQA